MVSGDPQNTNPKPSGKKKKKLSQKEQSERFIETARSLGVEDDTVDYEEAITKILHAKP